MASATLLTALPTSTPRPACFAAEIGRLSADRCTPSAWPATATSTRSKTTSGTPPSASLRSRSASPSRSRAVMSASRSSIMLTPPEMAGTKMSSSARSAYRVRSVTSSRSGADGRLYLDIPRTLWALLAGANLHAAALPQAARLANKLGNHFVAVEARHKQHAIHPIEDVKQELMCQLEAHLDAPLSRLLHFSQVLVGDDYPCQLVVAELGVPVALQRHDLDHGRDGRMRDARKEAVELLQVVERLGDGEVGTGFDLLVIPVQLVVEIVGHRVHGAGDQEVCGPTDRVAGPVDALVQLFDDADEAGRLDVPDAGRAGVAAHLGWIASQGNDVADAQRVRAQQL